ncbi:RIP metalloprotease RseP [Solibacillus sp. FSL W7-1472]|uniref:Zinc metalloprotease n=2 Tax=Solibacillus TaxID=648800 RepID=F2F2T4_SOLSS|nr:MULTISPECIES: RIP metalloprotease RseP [Solibacillus]AMO84726.1 RIP metalloprotease RseP [Solibacillus silvestris]EKB46835.1 Zinc metalloprotease rasP [Solibacillus isronensis B3W22]OBW58488.1 RIP metalloprotease RseP [Solibacillus silvestris]BAK17382.1 predicted membrane-associated Zn-dependent protease 1 [Solibacillus silvestris StLB046]
MQTVIAFILIFGSLVFFHELGHFLFAKRAGIMVREFAIGMGPKIFGMTKGETVYTLRLLPIGGYVRMAGEDTDTVELQPGYRVALITNEENIVEKIILNQKTHYQNVIFLEVERADLERELWIEGYDEDDQFIRYNVSRTASIVENGTEQMIAPLDRQFNSKSVGARAMAIFAGPLFNFILAFFIFLIIGLIQGIPSEEPIIAEVMDNSVASSAGLVDGDKVVKVNGQSISTWEELSEQIFENPNKAVTFEVERETGNEIIELTPKAVEQEGGPDYGQIGVMRSIEKNPLKAVVYGVEETYNMIITIGTLVGKLITGQFSIDALSGPVGIYKTTETVVTFGLYNILYFAAMLSVNLGIMNLLPLPALDGGRLLFFAVEAVRGKPIDRQKEGMVHFVGILLLMILMVVVTWNDIQRFFF